MQVDARECALGDVGFEDLRLDEEDFAELGDELEAFGKLSAVKGCNKVLVGFEVPIRAEFNRRMEFMKTMAYFARIRPPFAFTVNFRRCSSSSLYLPLLAFRSDEYAG